MTTTPATFQDSGILLQPLLADATHEASTAMCRWTNGLITLSLDEVREVPLFEAASQFDFANELLTMVVLTLDGELGGTMILTFDEVNGRELAASLLSRERCTDPEWTELERSALNETGNILGCAYMNSLTRMVEADLVPSPPYFVQDFGVSVLEQALMAQAATCDVATICRTTFHRQGQQLNWNVLFVPTETLRNRLLASIA